MSNRPIPDPAETAFRDLRGALHTGDGRAAIVRERRDGRGEADWADDLEDGQPDDRWLRFDSLGSRPGFRDMAEFLELVADEPLVAAVSKNDALATRRDITLDVIRDRALMSLPRGTGLCSCLDDACARLGFEPRITLEASNLGILASSPAGASASRSCRNPSPSPTQSCT